MEKKNSLFNLINHQPDVDNFFLSVKKHMKQNINF